MDPTRFAVIDPTGEVRVTEAVSPTNQFFATAYVGWPLQSINIQAHEDMPAATLLCQGPGGDATEVNPIATKIRGEPVRGIAVLIGPTDGQGHMADLPDEWVRVYPGDWSISDEVAL